MEDQIIKLRRLLSTKMATIAKLKKNIHHRNTQKEQRKRIEGIKREESEKNKKSSNSSKEEVLHYDNDIQKMFIESLLDNLKYPPNNRSYTNEILDICFALYSMSQKNYEILTQVLDIPSISTLKSYFSHIISEEKENLLKIENCSNIISNYRKTNILKGQFDIILGVDACSFDRLSTEGKKYCFCFYCQPLNPYLKCFPLHIVPSLNGKASDAIINIMHNLITILTNCDINVL